MVHRVYTKPADRVDAYFTASNCSGPDTHYVWASLPVHWEWGEYSATLTPNFHARRKAGELLPPRYYNREDYRFDAEIGYVAHEAKVMCSGTPTWLTAHADSAPSPFLRIGSGPRYREGLWENPFDLADMDLLALEAIAGITPDLDLLTSLAEAHKTVTMVLEARKSARNLIAKALRGGLHTAQAAGAAWLQWRYGWEQLARDLVNLKKLIDNPLRPLILTNKAFLHFEQVLQRTDIDCYVNPEREQQSTTTIDEQVALNATASVKVTSKTLNVLADIPVTMYELLPFSWVADWFVTIGDCLKAWSVLRKAETCYVSIGYKREVQSQTIQVSIPGPDAVNYRNGSGYGQAHDRMSKKVRIPYGIPSVIPSWRVELTSKRLADAAALLVTRIH